MERMILDYLMLVMHPKTVRPKMTVEKLGCRASDRQRRDPTVDEVPAQPGDQQQGEAALLWLLGQGPRPPIRPPLQGAPAQAVPPPGPAVHREEVPLPHP